eukprot:TRINITY_DN13484_c0_g1_i1.p1 TRINITY_DN13484_c0_g1~~TRINITY_DN13484_c0_g1_i1.p1  ORF type:complete len:349 (-),score=72.29 TRINITY_DN13484_c0_g1_i1:8-1054(-)
MKRKQEKDKSKANNSVHRYPLTTAHSILKSLPNDLWCYILRFGESHSFWEFQFVNKWAFNTFWDSLSSLEIFPATPLSSLAKCNPDHLSSITFHQICLTGSILKNFNSLPLISSLRLEECELKSSVPSEHFPALTDLHIHESDIRNFSSLLTHCPLTRLTLLSEPVSDSHFKHCSLLKSLKIAHSTGKSKMKFLAYAPLLTSLALLRNPHMKDFKEITSLPLLTHLTISSADISDETAVLLLKRLTKLVSLKLKFCPKIRCGSWREGGVRGLLRLNLRGTPVGDEDLQNLLCLPSLRVLDISDTQVTSRGLTFFTQFKHLECIKCVGCNGVSQIGLCHVQAVWLMDKI